MVKHTNRYKLQSGDITTTILTHRENKCVLLNQWLNCAQFNIDKFIQGSKFITDLINDIDIYKLFFTKSNHFIGIIKNQEALSCYE